MYYSNKFKKKRWVVQNKYKLKQINTNKSNKN